MTKVLIVEDTATFRAILRHQLVSIGVTSVWMAADGEEALGMLEHEPDFDAILCDWHMHPMDGLSFCAKLQGLPALGGRVIPIFFITADPKLADADKRARMLEPAKGLGIVDVLPKPFTADTLRDALRQVGIIPS